MMTNQDGNKHKIKAILQSAQQPRGEGLGQLPQEKIASRLTKKVKPVGFSP